MTGYSYNANEFKLFIHRNVFEYVIFVSEEIKNWTNDLNFDLRSKLLHRTLPSRHVNESMSLVHSLSLEILKKTLLHYFCLSIMPWCYQSELGYIKCE